MPTAFITGATGFIGQHLLNVMKDKGHTLTILSSSTVPEFWSGYRPAKMVQGVLGSIQDWKSNLTGHDAVIHLASELRTEDNMEDVNNIGAADLAKAALEADIKIFIHLSSVGVVGSPFSGTNLIVTEESVCSPKNKYEETKWKGEKSVEEILNSKCRLVIIRPTNVYGDHSQRNILLGLIQKIKAGNSIPYSRTAYFNYVYAGDVALAIYKALTGRASGVYNIGTPVLAGTFLREIARTLNVELRSRQLPQWMFRIVALVTGREFKGKISSLCNRVRYSDEKWKRVTGFDHGDQSEGIKNTIEWYRNKKAI